MFFMVGIFNVKIEDVCCFYFCEHFHEAFFKKELIKQASVIQLLPHEEVIAYCIDCKKNIYSVYSEFDSLSDNFFNKAKKNLIQYFSIVKYKGACVIDIQCFWCYSKHAN